jgi:hypothetical protein
MFPQTLCQYNESHANLAKKKEQPCLPRKFNDMRESGITFPSSIFTRLQILCLKQIFLARQKIYIHFMCTYGKIILLETALRTYPNVHINHDFSLKYCPCCEDYTLYNRKNKYRKDEQDTHISRLVCWATLQLEQRMWQNISCKKSKRTNNSMVITI